MRIELPLGVQVHDNCVFRTWAIAMVVQILGKYMILGYLDPQGTIPQWTVSTGKPAKISPLNCGIIGSAA